MPRSDSRGHGSRHKHTRVSAPRGRTTPVRWHHTHFSQDIPDPESALIGYVSKVWVHEHDVPDTYDALARVNKEQLQREYRQFLQQGRTVPTRGCTLEELFLGGQIAFRTQLICLINKDQPQQLSQRIKRKAILSPDLIVDFVLRGFEVGTLGTIIRRSLNGSVLVAANKLDWPGPYFTYVYDGEFGHAITLFGLDSKSGKIVYYDPWPGKSLLSAGQNSAGVASVPYIDPGGGRYWMLHRSELEQIVFAVSMPVKHWEDVTGSGTAVH